ncbi:DENN domain-containing protein 4B-like, partial [Cetorhinus maximus]
LQAVLESKWPSSNQGGRLRWAKLRNVILATAQFRRPLRERRLQSVARSLLERSQQEPSRAGPRFLLQRHTTWAGRSASIESWDGLGSPLVKSRSASCTRTERSAVLDEHPSDTDSLSRCRVGVGEPGSRSSSAERPRWERRVKGLAKAGERALTPEPAGHKHANQTCHCLQPEAPPLSNTEPGKSSETPEVRHTPRTGRKWGRESGRDHHHRRREGTKKVDENCNNVMLVPRGLSEKFHSLLTSTANRRPLLTTLDSGRRGSSHSDLTASSEKLGLQSARESEEEDWISLMDHESMDYDTSNSDLRETSDSRSRTSSASLQTAIIEVLLSSCSLCTSCASLVYDEEIMAGWTADDSNLNTTCPFCTRSFLPLLNIEIYEPHLQQTSSQEGSVSTTSVQLMLNDHHGSTMSSSSTQSPVLSDRSQILSEDETEADYLGKWSSTLSWLGSRRGELGPERVTVAYVSPLVLRKELESLMENEGDTVLSQAEFVDKHPIIFWNLVWYFHRLELPHNLLQLVLTSQHIKPPTQDSPLWMFHSNMLLRVRILWDVLTLDPNQCPPLYVLWRMYSQLPVHQWRTVNQPFTLSYLEEVVRYVGLNEVHKAINMIIETLGHQPAQPPLQRSLYREILFLTMAALGKDNMDIGIFDKRYRAACTRLASSRGPEQLKQDRVLPPSAKAVDCRKTFGALLEC